MGNFGDLPAEIMLDIFTRLPAESVLDCKSVSKTWRNVLHHPSFSQIHSDLLLSNLDSSVDSGKFSFIFEMSNLSEPFSEQLYYLEYDDEVSSLRVKKLNLNPPFELYGIVGSCNGLICINGLPNHYNSSYVACICNPITRECITLPELDRSTYYDLVDFMLCGFGYIASTNEYKVVRLYAFTFPIYTSQREDEHIYAQIEVYTLGSGKGWRNAGKINNPIARRNPVFANGFLFWASENGRIMAFDLANEIFVEFDESWNGKYWGGVLGGYFCGTRYSKDGKDSDVWLMKKKEDESFRWNKEFSLINTDPYTTSLALTSSGIVLCYSDTKIYLYDLKSFSSKMLEDFGRGLCTIVPHINTLISLKAFGEENMRSIEPGESAIEEAKSRD